MFIPFLSIPPVYVAFFRVLSFLSLSSVVFYDAFYVVGIKNFWGFLSNWVALFTTFSFLISTVLYSLGAGYDGYWDTFAGSLFEVALPLNIVTNIMFWAYIYPFVTPWMIDLQNNPFSLFYTFGVMVLPLFTLCVEWFMNSRLFDFTRTFFYSMIFMAAYIPITYFGKDFMGSYPYASIGLDWTDYKTPMWIAIFFASEAMSYIVTAFFTNTVKSGFTLHNPLFKDDLKVLTDLISILQ
jgi:hypothetical protein